MEITLRFEDGRLRASGGGSSSNVIDDADWDELREHAEREANHMMSSSGYASRETVEGKAVETLPELAVFGTPDLVELPRVLTLCNSELMNWVTRHPADLGAIGTRAFEEIIAEIMKTFGFEVQLTPQTKDGGYDILAVKKDIIGIATHYIIECKHPTINQIVGVLPVRALYGVKEQTKAEHAILVTDYRFSRDAWKFANDPHVWNLHLKDKTALLEWIDLYKNLKHL